MFNFWQVPDCLTFGSRVRQSDCLCSFWMNIVLFMCFPEMEGLCPDYHHGTSRLVVTDTECSPKVMKARSQPSANDPFPMEENSSPSWED